MVVNNYASTAGWTQDDWDAYNSLLAGYEAGSNPALNNVLNVMAEERNSTPTNQYAKYMHDNTNNSSVVANNYTGQYGKYLHDDAGNSVSFSPADTYKIRADGYYNQGNTAMGDAYSALWKGSDAFANTAKQMNDFFNVYASDVWQRENALAGMKSQVANKLYNDMAEQRQYVMDTFGPNGSLTKEINRYYDDLGNYLSTDAGRAAAKIAAQGMHSGASLGAIRAQQNAAYNDSFARYVQAKEQEINAKQTIAGNLINYMSTLRQEYGDTTNTFIISQYQRANDLLNAISQSIASSNIELNNAKLSNSLKGSGGNGTFSPDHKIFTQFESEMLTDPWKIAAWNNMTAAQKQASFSNWLYGKAGWLDDTKDLTNGGQETTDTTNGTGGFIG